MSLDLVATSSNDFSDTTAFEYSLRDSPSKLPCSVQNWSSLAWVSMEGQKTNTPELKQSGQPGSGAADSSSLSNSSSMLESTWGRRSNQRMSQRNKPHLQHWRIKNRICLVWPVCLRPWRHIWSIASASSSAAWWRWRPGRASSSWPGVPCLHCPARPPPAPRRRLASARPWWRAEVQRGSATEKSWAETQFHKWFLLERIGHLWTNECHQLLGRLVVPEGLAQNQGPTGVVVICGQRHKSLVCGDTVRTGNQAPRSSPSLGFARFVPG